MQSQPVSHLVFSMSTSESAVQTQLEAVIDFGSDMARTEPCMLEFAMMVQSSLMRRYSAAVTSVDIRPISANETVALRHAVLWPSVPIDSEIIRLPEDDSGYHLGAFVQGTRTPVAVISVFKEDIAPTSFPVRSTDASSSEQPHPVSFRFRKFACYPAFQGRGIGSALLAHTMDYCRTDMGAGLLWCDARVTAVSWYEKRGLEAFGDTWFKGTTEYIKMRKLL